MNQIRDELSIEDFLVAFNEMPGPTSAEIFSLLPLRTGEMELNEAFEAMRSRIAISCGMPRHLVIPDAFRPPVWLTRACQPSKIRITPTDKLYPAP